MQHVSFTPVPPLAGFIERFWFFSDAPAHRKERILPSGTIELVFNLAEDEIRIYDAKQPTECKRLSGAAFSGTYRQPFVIDTREHASILSVHFRPAGAFSFLGLPASELADGHVDLETVWGTSARELRERLCAATNSSDRFAILENALVARFNTAMCGHRAVRAALNTFGHSNHETTTRTLAAQIGISQRHFIRLFSEEVGMKPNLFRRIQRFQGALEVTRKSTRPNWAAVAVACGYFDQAHFINDFRILAGLTPTEYHRQCSERVLTNHVPISD